MEPNETSPTTEKTGTQKTIMIVSAVVIICIGAILTFTLIKNHSLSKQLATTEQKLRTQTSNTASLTDELKQCNDTLASRIEIPEELTWTQYNNDASPVSFSYPTRITDLTLKEFGIPDDAAWSEISQTLTDVTREELVPHTYVIEANEGVCSKNAHWCGLYITAYKYTQEQSKFYECYEGGCLYTDILELKKQLPNITNTTIDGKPAIYIDGWFQPAASANRTFYIFTDDYYIIVRGGFQPIDQLDQFEKANTLREKHASQYEDFSSLAAPLEDGALDALIQNSDDATFTQEYTTLLDNIEKIAQSIKISQ